ncbi:MAG: hypothetical protein AMXMBFR61_01050 [Fimbriimonadales bacterium]
MSLCVRRLCLGIGASAAVTLFSGCGAGGGLTSGEDWVQDFENGFSGRGRGVQVFPIPSTGPAVFISAAGGDVTSLAFTPTPTLFRNSKIAYASSRAGNYDIYVMDYDGTNVRQLTTHPGADRNPSITADGTKVFFESDRTGTPQIWVINTDGTGERQLTFTSASETQPHVSRDGSMVAFVSNRFGNSEVLMMGPDGLNQRRLTEHSAVDEQPQISPTGTHLCWVSTRADGRRHVFRMDLSTGTINQVTSGGGSEVDPRWSPDGQVIAFVSASGWIYTIKPDGTGVTPVLTGLPVRSQPDFSPDGQKIVYTADLGNNLDLYVANRDGTGTPVRLTNEPTFEMAPSVSGSALPRRVFVGAAGSDMGRDPVFGSSIGGFICSLAGSVVGDVISIDGSQRSALLIDPLYLGNDAGLVGAQVTGTTITSMLQDNGRLMSPTRIIGTGGIFPATSDALQLFFNPTTGRLMSVVPIGRGRAEEPGGGFENGRLVIRGAVRAAIDMERKVNIAPDGATEVSIDPATGRIMSVQ